MMYKQRLTIFLTGRDEAGETGLTVHRAHGAGAGDVSEVLRMDVLQ